MNVLEHTILHQNETFSGKQFQQKCSVFQLTIYKLAQGGSNGGLNFLPVKQFSLRYETKKLYKPLPKSGALALSNSCVTTKVEMLLYTKVIQYNAVVAFSKATGWDGTSPDKLAVGSELERDLLKLLLSKSVQHTNSETIIGTSNSLSWSV